MSNNGKADKNSIQLLEKEVNWLNDNFTKFKELITQPNAIFDAMIVNNMAKDISIRAKRIVEHAEAISLLASIKEQHDLAAEQAAQRSENFTAVLQGRDPVKVKKR